MQASKHRHRVLTFAFLLILAVPPLAQVAIDLQAGRVPGCLGLFTRPPTAAGLRSFEEDIEAESWFIDSARPLVGHAQFMLFGDPGQDAVVGRDGWLFYAPGVEYLTESRRSGWAKAVQDCIAAVCDFNEQLAAHGIHLIVVPAPGKASIYPDKLGAQRTVNRRRVPRAV